MPPVHVDLIQIAAEAGLAAVARRRVGAAARIVEGVL
jgi:hypothetical protein